MISSKLLCSALFGTALAVASLNAAESREEAPSFRLINPRGAPVGLSQYKGKVVLLDFWATWCTGCKVEIPWYMQFSSKYKRLGLVVLGVAMDDTWQPVKQFVKEKKMNYPVVLGNETIAKQYGLTSMPKTLLIDRDGRIAWAFTGIVDRDQFESELKSLLAAR
jgi:cytochrome c biogenesis protein CcmG/thiol:disulfide interchange protein DsbE